MERRRKYTDSCVGGETYECYLADLVTPERAARATPPLDDAKIARVRFHDLRHSAASLLLAAGVPLVEVSMLLGHSELRVTADLYSHLPTRS